MKLLEALDNFLHSCYSTSRVSGQKFYRSVILRAVESSEFRERLVKDPDKVLAEAGVALPKGLKVSFVENTKDVVHIAIPPYIGE